MKKGDSVYVINVGALHIETGTLVANPVDGLCDVRMGRTASRLVDAWRVFADYPAALRSLASHMRKRAAQMCLDADEIEDRAARIEHQAALTPSSPHTPGG